MGEPAIIADINQPVKPVEKKQMPKKIGIRQMMQKTYQDVIGLTPEMQASLGEIEDAFEMIAWGDSGNGKTNFVMEVMCQISTALNCKAAYISWEEGHGKSLRNTLMRHNMLERMGNRLEIVDGGTFDQVYALIKKRKSPKVWVFDSIQASNFTKEQIEILRAEFVLSKKKKIFLYISWAQGKMPLGSAAIGAMYMCNIKTFVKDFIAFPRSRFNNGSKNYIIWTDGAKKKWGIKEFNKHKNN